MKRIFVLLPFILSLSLLSCTKQGTQGPAGAQGNANVQVLVIPNQSFGANLVVFLNDPQITQNILDSGAVMIATRPTTATGTPADWIDLPFVYPHDNLSIYPWTIALGKALVVANFNSADYSNYDFRITVIGGH